MRGLTKLLAVWVVTAGACASEPAAPGDPADPSETTDEPADDPTPDDPTTPLAATDWASTPIPFVAYFHDVSVAYTIRWTASADGAMTAPIDAVVGLANGRVDALTDLGPIVRLNPDGFLDVRDGATYRADAVVDYRNAAVAIVMSIDLENRRYSVEANGVQLATNYGFLAEQAGMFRVDTLASRVETDGATIEIADLVVGPEWCSVAGQGWVNLEFPAQTSAFRVQFDAQVPYDATDAVIGLSAGAPAAQADLAAAVRFNPSGTLEARNGSTYAASQPIGYAAYGIYRVSMEVDVAAKRYSVNVAPKDEAGLGPRLAGDYAFRTEQSAAAALTRIGMLAGGNGYVRVCNVMVWNY